MCVCAVCVVEEGGAERKIKLGNNMEVFAIRMIGKQLPCYICTHTHQHTRTHIQKYVIIVTHMHTQMDTHGHTHVPAATIVGSTWQYLECLCACVCMCACVHELCASLGV